MFDKNTTKEPLFHISKRLKVTTKTSIITRTIAIVSSIIIVCLLCTVVSGKSPFLAFTSLIKGNIGSKRRIWIMFRDTALLLGVALALVPAFKMKFWNLGANGQIFVSCLATTGCMHLLQGKVPEWVAIVLMVVTSISAGIIWAVIPAIFKAFFKTNESLFTLMMNYVAQFMVSYFIV